MGIDWDGHPTASQVGSAEVSPNDLEPWRKRPQPAESLACPQHLRWRQLLPDFGMSDIHTGHSLSTFQDLGYVVDPQLLCQSDPEKGAASPTSGLLVQKTTFEFSSLRAVGYEGSLPSPWPELQGLGPVQLQWTGGGGWGGG